ncbi:MFS transporter [Amycolatopsis circi]|uniref:MFS transporter n=1 Tax=Amycolatopsis circi TaxID=871959 RepID=UPI000E235827|nr:MFS transporter [Amycolatopsis circi]
MNHAAAPTAGRRAALASFAGTAIEWYDFYLYGTASALVFGKLFFPELNPATGVLAAFGTFWVGFLARPLGGIVFGHLGDRVGRKNTLVVTLLLMGFATFAVGLLPTYAKIGIAAPLLLVALRAVQGVAVGGEWGGAVVLAAENAPAGRGSYFAMFAQQGSPAGAILSTVVFLAVGALPDEQFLTWGWRVPFLLSGVLVALGLVIRLKVEEPAEFLRAKATAAVAKVPLLEVLRTAWRTVLLGIGASIMGIAAAYFSNTFVLAWSTNELGIGRQTMLYVLLGASVVQFCWQPVAARLAERVGETRFMAFSLAGNIVVTVPMYLLIASGNPGLAFVGIAVATVCGSGYYAVLAGFLTRGFPIHLRYTGISLSYQLCSTIFGGTTPFIAQALLNSTHGAIWPVVIYHVVLLALTLTCVLALARRTAAVADSEKTLTRQG